MKDVLVLTAERGVWECMEGMRLAGEEHGALNLLMGRKDHWCFEEEFEELCPIQPKPHVMTWAAFSDGLS